MITDKYVLRQLNIVNMPELTDSVLSYPEDERDGRTDLQLLLNEACYFLDMYDEGGTVFSDGLEWAKEWMRETKNGTQYRLKELSPSYIAKCNNDTMSAKNTINEYKRLRNLVKRLEAKR